jgi:hypothetical protein
VIEPSPESCSCNASDKSDTEVSEQSQRRTKLGAVAVRGLHCFWLDQCSGELPQAVADCRDGRHHRLTKERCTNGRLATGLLFQHGRCPDSAARRDKSAVRFVALNTVKPDKASACLRWEEGSETPQIILVATTGKEAV